VIGRIQSWFEEWSAAPAIYIDCPTVTEQRCYDEADAAGAVIRRAPAGSAARRRR
jgi:hypothetical protein